MNETAEAQTKCEMLMKQETQLKAQVRSLYITCRYRAVFTPFTRKKIDSFILAICFALVLEDIYSFFLSWRVLITEFERIMLANRILSLHTLDVQ